MGQPRVVLLEAGVKTFATGLLPDVRARFVEMCQEREAIHHWHIKCLAKLLRGYSLPSLSAARQPHHRRM